MIPSDKKPLNVTIWGTYDTGKPRTRLLIEAIRSSGASVTEIHAPIWEGAEDKSVLRFSQATGRIMRVLAAYPSLVWRFLRGPRPDAVVIPYPGHLDVLVFKPFAWLRRTPIVWDAFLSAYDTIVDDRVMISPRHPLAFGLKAWEWLACRAANRVVLDTQAQADYFRTSYSLAAAKTASVPVGSEEAAFPVLAGREMTGRASVLFYGQFIPLHGIETIVEAAKLSRDLPIDWQIIGTGQMADEIRDMLKDDHPSALKWEDWVPYTQLSERIAAADVCLGVFGESAKAGRVIPNKVFQILSAGRPLVTRDGAGIRELVGSGSEAVELVAPNDPAALLAAVKRLLDAAPYPPDLHSQLRKRFSPELLAIRWAEILDGAVSK